MNEPKPPRRLRPLPPPGGGPPVIPGPRAPARPVAPPAAPVLSAPIAGQSERDPARKLIRPSLDVRAPRASGGPARRREAPPDATGHEAALLAKLAGSGATVAVRLETGEVVRGQLEWADRSCVKLRRPDLPSLLVMKHAILSLEAEAGSRRG